MRTLDECLDAALLNLRRVDSRRCRCIEERLPRRLRVRPRQRGTFSGQDYFPDEMQRRQFYDPLERGFEREIAKRLAYWQSLREKRSKRD